MKQTIYTVHNGAFCTEQASKRFNRALYGKYYEGEGSRIRILSGELPEFLLLHKKDRGRLFFRVQEGAGTKRLSQASSIKMNYYQGRTVQTIQDEALGDGTLLVETVPDLNLHGAIIKIEWTGNNPLPLYAITGCASMRESPRGLDPGYYNQDAEGICYQAKDAKENEFSFGTHSIRLANKNESDRYAAWLICEDAKQIGLCSAEEEGNPLDCEKMKANEEKDEMLAYMKIICKPHQIVWLRFVCEWEIDEENALQMISDAFEAATAHYQQISMDTNIQTPSEVLNGVLQTASLVLEGCWQEAVFAHGAWAWDIPIMGWRSMYGPGILGMEERVWKEAELFTGLQLDENGNCVDPEMEKWVMENPNFPEGDAYFDGQNRAGKKKQGTGGGVADEKWGLARQAKESIFVSEGMMPFMPKAARVPMYDMQEVFIDEILYMIEHTGDKKRAKQFFDAVMRHLDWEERCFDHDKNGLYENFANFWASDAVFSSGGAGAIATAYNYRANRCMEQLAKLLGKDSQTFQEKAEQIQKAFFVTLWKEKEGSVVEWKDRMGEQLEHMAVSVPTLVHVAESGLLSQTQIRRMLENAESQLERSNVSGGVLIWNTNWTPYTWSVRDVDFADLFHLALTYFQNGLPEKGLQVLTGAATQSSCNMVSPGTFMTVLDGKGSDFADTASMYVRCVYEGLFGIRHHLEEEREVNRIDLAPHFPDGWETASIQAHDVSYSWKRQEKEEQLQIRVSKAASIRVSVRKNFEKIQNIWMVDKTDSDKSLNQSSNSNSKQSIAWTIEWLCDTPYIVIEIPNECGEEMKITLLIEYAGARCIYKESWKQTEENTPEPIVLTTLPKLDESRQQTVSLKEKWNAKVCDIFREKYLSPRPDTCSLQVPYHLYPSDWCHVDCAAVEKMNDQYLRSCVQNDCLTLKDGLTFEQPKSGVNTIFVSKWDNFPDQAEVAIEKQAKKVWLLAAVYTNQMQCEVANVTVTICYADQEQETIDLTTPTHLRSLERGPQTERPCDAWCYRKQPVDRILIGSTKEESKISPQDGVYAQVLGIAVKPKTIEKLIWRARANDIVAGLMAVTLQIS